MKKIAILSFLIFASSFIAGSRTLTLEECLTLAFENNLSLKAGEAALGRASALKGTAFDAPNTGIELSQDATGGGSMENGLKFSQEFEFPTVYIAKRKVLKADYDVEEGSFRELRNKLSGDVSAAYYRLVFACQKIQILNEMSEVYSEFARIADERYNAGETSRLESINAARIMAKNGIALKEAQLARRQASSELSALLGIDDDIEPGDSALPVLDIPLITQTLQPESTLRGQIGELKLKQSERNLGLAKHEFMPGLFIAATSQLLIKGFNPYDVDRSRFDKGNFMGFQVGVTVPLFFGAKRAKLQAAKKEVEFARLKKEEENRSILKEYTDALNDYETAAQSLEYYEGQGISQANEMVRLAAISYELGEIDYLEFIQNMETASSVRLEYLESIFRYNLSIITLNTLKGNQ